jgi:1,2-diacylglycerol 3-alpha-glucosyltransferase
MTASLPTLALLHHQFGPYHVARARALRATFPGEVAFIQLAHSEAIRAWSADPGDLGIETAVEGALEASSAAAIDAGVERILERILPSAIAISGYGHRAMRHASTWARRRGAKTILISDSHGRNLRRYAWLERIKKAFVKRHFDAAFVSGAYAARYAESLGIPGHRIWRGYDVVDNDHFAAGARRARAGAAAARAALGLPERYLLFVGRFSPEKNLPRLIKAFERACVSPTLDGWSLVLVGGGPLEPELRRLADPLGSRVAWVPFQQLERIPAYYGLAEALVLPSLNDTWGLVVNEGMAAGLPIVISQQCGCVPELVFPGLNGYVINEEDVADMAGAFVDLARDEGRRRAFGAYSERLIQGFSLETWAATLKDCALSLTRSGALLANSRAAAAP